ncbi:chorismate synthase [Candidatus Karelsulcia muelleri]|uniref:chorismate synthase n=1 Tax=Candidatus Karelsulcia muelleri TaxID=336810 RepID=UPI00216A3DB2|nr:chorismate synthase [Candidatus Karelsulcia muelleri]
MAGNNFGKLFRVTTFGESHGYALGGIIDGCPSGLKLNFEEINNELNRRKPGQSSIVTQRKESDEVIFLSGIFNGFTTGTPIGFIIKNKDHNSKDYFNIKDIYRPSHSDFTYYKKYGIRDYRGGGRSSARETVSRVVAGAIAKQLLKIYNIFIKAYVSSIGNLILSDNYNQLDLSKIEYTPIRCPDRKLSEKMIDSINNIRKKGDTLGGIITCHIKNVPIGIGEPVFDKLHAELGKAMLSINAVKVFEYGSGFVGTKIKGSNHNDLFTNNETTKTNFSGGTQGGLSNGMDIYFNVGFKPVATIMNKQKSIDINFFKKKILVKGRHDPCVLPRAVPIVEAMSALVLYDNMLNNRVSKI